MGHEKPNYREATLETIGAGKAIHQFNHELKRVIDNCLDINTTSNYVRKVVLTVRIKPSDDRKYASINFEAGSKIAPDAAGVDQMYFSKREAYVMDQKQMTFEEYESNIKELNNGTEGEDND